MAKYGSTWNVYRLTEMSDTLLRLNRNRVKNVLIHITILPRLIDSIKNCRHFFV